MKELQYKGDFETFFALCQKFVCDGIGMAYNFNIGKGIAVTNTDPEKRTQILIKKDDITLEIL